MPHGTGILLDPPYKDCRKVYRYHDPDVAAASYEWAVQHGWDVCLSLAYCCNAGDFPCPRGWSCYEWRNNGYGKNWKQGDQDPKPAKEHIFFSPGCFPLRFEREGYVKVYNGDQP